MFLWNITEYQPSTYAEELLVEPFSIWTSEVPFELNSETKIFQNTSFPNPTGL